MKRVSFGDEISIGDLDEDQFFDLVDRVRNTIENAKDNGLVDISVEVSSTFEPYGDFLGTPVLEVFGHREYNEEEEKQNEKDRKVADLSKRLGIAYYEAEVLLRLKEAGKVICA